FLLMLELVSKSGKKLSELLKPYREQYFITGEINTPVKDVALKLQELKEHYAGQGTVTHLDGISVDADTWHFNVRPSNTEPLLRHGRPGDFVMRANDVEYFAPAVFDDEIEVFVRVSRVGKTSVTFQFAAYRERDDVLMVTAHQTLVYVDLAERTKREVPADYR